MIPAADMVRSRAAVLVILATAACGRSGTPVPQGYLFEKGPYQAVYGPDGRILRLLYDGDGDGMADVVTLFTDGRPRQVETDSDGDRVVDRWEFFAPGGALEKVATSRRRSGTPDLWEYLDPAGAVVRRELDEDRDGKVDRIESFEAGRLARVALDTDRDGRMDRWQEWRSGRLVSEEIDTDGDGRADRRLRYGVAGEVRGLEKLAAR